MAPLHVMHVLFDLRTGGLETQVVNLINASDRDRFHHSICCLDPDDAELAEALKEPKPPIHIVRKRPGISPALPFRFLRLFVREKVDVVHTGSFGTYLYLVFAARLTRTAVVYGEHGDLAFLRDKARFRAAMRLLGPATNQLYAVSGRGRQTVADLTGQRLERIELVPNGVDTERFSPGDSAAARRRIRVEPDAFVVGFVGRLDPVKNLDALFAALPPLLAAVPDAALLMVGDGPEREKVERLAAESPRPDRVHLLGRRTDVAELLPAMSVVVLPSFSEMNSMALIEAMAAGRPLVASRVGGNPELVREDETGFLFEPDRPAELADRLIKLARSDEMRARLGGSAREIAVNEYAMPVTVRRHEAMYERVARRKGA